jgi:hypothetical protein
MRSQRRARLPHAAQANGTSRFEQRKIAGPPIPRMPLLEAGADRFEFVVQQLAADAIDRRDDRERDAGGNQPIFDRGGTDFIVKETFKQIHFATPDEPFLLTVAVLRSGKSIRSIVNVFTIARGLLAAVPTPVRLACGEVA